MGLDTYVKANTRELFRLAQNFQNFRIDNVPIGTKKAHSRIIQWYKNFEQLGYENYDLLTKLLKQIDYIREETISLALSEKLRETTTKYECYIAPLGELSESSMRFTMQNNRYQGLFASLPELLESYEPDPRRAIVLMDDFLNSGGQLQTIFSRLLGLSIEAGKINDEGESRTVLSRLSQTKLLRSKVVILYYRTMDSGLLDSSKILKEDLKLDIEIVPCTTDSFRVGIFGDSHIHENLRIEEYYGIFEVPGQFKGMTYYEIGELFRLLELTGEAILRHQQPNWSDEKILERVLGYGNMAHGIVTDYNTPTITITSIWNGGEISVNGKTLEWFPLFPRTKKILGTGKKVELLQHTGKTTQIQHPSSQFTRGQLLQAVHEESKLHLKRNYDDIDESRLDESLVLFSKLLATFARFDENRLGQSNFEGFVEMCREGQVFEYLYEVIFSDDRCRNPIQISGYAGCGKTAFLSLLYHYLRKKLMAIGDNRIPIYISLHYYNKYAYQEQNGEFSKQAQRMIQGLFLKLNQLVEASSNVEFIFILDGADEFSQPKVQVGSFLATIIEQLPVRYKIVGVRKQKSKFERDADSANLDAARFLDNPIISVWLHKLSTSSRLLPEFIESYSSFESFFFRREKAKVKQVLESKIIEFKLTEVDLFICKILLDPLRRIDKYHSILSFSAHIEAYFNAKSVNIRKSSDIAFRLYNHIRQPKITPREKNTDEWWQLHRNEAFRDFLVAYYIVDNLSGSGKKVLSTFQFVYPDSINEYCKEIINKSVTNQEKVVSSIRNLLESFGVEDSDVKAHENKLRARTHLCYLLGRIKDDHNRKAAFAILKKEESKVRPRLGTILSGDPKVQFTLRESQLLELLLLRTIYISLAYLGESESLRDLSMDYAYTYVTHLLNHRDFDSLNRGFHLQYYEDIEFVRSPGNLIRMDSLEGFDRTFLKLSAKVRQSLDTGHRYNLFEIELYTLVSLAQHRHALGVDSKFRLEDGKRIVICEIIKGAIGSGIDLRPPLREYLGFMLPILEDRDFRIGKPAQHLLGLKGIKRYGWTIRGVPDSESVSDHIWAAGEIAKLFLPVRLSGFSKYDKSEIIEMIEIHDCGEAFVGDMHPDDKGNKDVAKRERDYIVRLSLLGTFSQYAPHSEKIRLYDRFMDEGDITDINAQIARDIDKIDNLVQLFEYRRLPVRSNEFDKDFIRFRNYLLNRIKAEESKRIARIFIESYDDVSEKDSILNF